MSEIDFLSNKNTEKDEKDKKEKKNEADIKWTNSASGKLPVNNKNDNYQQAKRETGVGSQTEKDRQERDKDRLKKSRQEVLSMIKEKKDRQKNKGSMDKKKGGSSLFSWLGRLNFWSDRKSLADKKDKEILMDYQEVFKKEKGERKGETEFTSLAPSPSESKDSKDGNIGSVIKDKLKTLSPNKWKAPKILKTNLIKGEVTTFFDWKKNLKVLAVNIFIACSIIVIIYGGLAFWEIRANQQRELLFSEIEEIKQKIIKIESEIKEVEIFQKKIELASLLLNKHIYWTNFFKFLEENTLSSVYYTGGFSGDIDGEYILSAQANSFSTIADQAKVLRANDKVLSVSVSSGNLASSGGVGGGGSTVGFSLELSIKPNVFNK
jgi:hypothetical protein